MDYNEQYVVCACELLHVLTYEKFWDKSYTQKCHVFF